MPDYKSSLGQEAIELAEVAGLVLDPWQQYVIHHGLGMAPGGHWAAFEVGLVVSRQNGKGSIAECRELAGLFLLDEELIIHSAHEFATASEAFRRLCFLIESTPELDNRVKAIHRAHGQEGIELKNGQRIRFRTRTSGGGRGFTADCLILDEAMIISEAMQGAILPTLSSIENPQVWYTGSAVNEDVHRDGVVFTRIRNRGLTENPGRLFFAEWSADEDRFLNEPGYGYSMDAACEANPAAGIRISEEFIEAEQRTLSPTNYMVERLGIGKWPNTDAVGDKLIKPDDWQACGDPDSQIYGALTFAIDVAPGFRSASIAVAGLRPNDQIPHFEIIESEPGSAWLINRVIDLSKKNPGSQFVCDPRSPVVSMISDLERAYVNLNQVTSSQFTAACGSFFDLFARQAIRYPAPQPEVNDALLGAAIRETGDTWVLSRKKSEVDISPLVTSVLAVWGCLNLRQPTVWSLAEMQKQILAERAAANSEVPDKEQEPEPVSPAPAPVINPRTGRPIKMASFTPMNRR